MSRITPFGIAATALALSLGCVIYLLHLSFFPDDPIVLQRPMQVSGAVYAGELLPVRASYCKPAGRLATVGYSLIAEKPEFNIIPLPSTVSMLPAGCHDAVVFHFIPAYTPEGEYRLYVTHEYHITPFITAQRAFISEPFYVAKRQVPGPPPANEP